jgi:antitoxin component of RelBE/YafQ-DinJ toxin-antitoxin module
MTKSDTIEPVPEHALSVRLDSEADAALEVLVGTGMTQSQAIRLALVEAAQRRRGDLSLAAEAARLAADPIDLREIADIREFMDELDAPG